MTARNFGHFICRAMCVVSTLALSGCFDVGLGRSNCTVLGQAPAGSANGLSVWVTLPSQCPFSIGGPGHPVVFSATVSASEAFVPDYNNLWHKVYNRRGQPLIGTFSTPWIVIGNGTLRSPVAGTFNAGTGQFIGPTGQINWPVGTGHDTWVSSQTQLDVDDFNSLVQVRAEIILSHYTTVYAAMDVSSAVPQPYEPVTLTAHAPSYIAGPYHYAWYRNGVYVQSGGPSFTVSAGGPGENTSVRVVITGSDQQQIRGEQIVIADTPCDPSVQACM